MADRVGQQLGNYRLTRRLGKGGFSEVYLGEHVFLKTQAAVKLLRGQMTEKKKEVFLAEARTIAALEHPHIVPVLDFGIEADIPYLVMSYTPNGSLRELHDGAILPLSTILSYVKQIVDALQYAHARKIVHRDLKPDNLLLGKQQQVLLSDFGISVDSFSIRYVERQEVTGTPQYMAPEQWDGKARSASDQYSLAVVVYEWLCGQPPFSGNMYQLFDQHKQVPPPSLCEKVPTIPPNVEQVVMKALAKDHKQRFGSVLEFAEALEDAYPPPGGRQSPRHRISRRAVVTGIGLGVGLIVGGGIVWLVFFPSPTHIPLGSVLHTYRGHIDHVNAVAWSSDGKRIASGSFDKTVQVWNAADGGHAFTYRGHSDPVNAVAWSPDGRRIVSGSNDKTVQVWDAADGGHVFTYREHSDVVLAVAWSPDGKRIASGSVDKTVQVWDATDGGHLFTYKGHSDVVDTVAWSPDGKRIVSGSYDKTARVWDATDGGHPFTYQGHSGFVHAVAWSPDSKRIASGSDDTTVQMWDAADGGHPFTYRGHTDLVLAVAWNPVWGTSMPDGRRIVSGSFDKTVQVWDAADGSHPFTYRGHSVAVDTVAWSPDGTRIASGSYDKTVQVWGAG